MAQGKAKQGHQLAAAIFKDVSMPAEGPCPWGV